MTTTADRRMLASIADQARATREALTAELDKIAKSQAWSESHKAQLAEQARDRAAQTIAGLKDRADQAGARLAAYRPTTDVTDTQVSRAATRVAAMLDAGEDLGDVLRLAASTGDAAMIEAAREAAPVRIRLATRGRAGADQAAKLAEFHQHADVAMARVLHGTPAGQAAADALLGRAGAALTAQELTAAQATTEGRTVGGLSHAIAGRYAQQEFDTLAAQLDQSTN